MRALETEITPANIRPFVIAFYRSVLNDAELAPVFEKAIGKDLADWGPHLETMYSFWETVMLGAGNYHGNPLKKHQDLPPFPAELFDSWLKLFERTARETYAPELAERFIQRASLIAITMRQKLYPKS